MTRLAFFADMQMGASYGGIPTALAEQEEILRTILRTARDEGCQAVLFGGDGTQHRNPSPDVLLAWERPLIEHRALAPDVPVVAVAGNHDIRNLDLGSGLDVLALAGLLGFHREPAVRPVAGCIVAVLPWAPVHRLVAQAGGGDRDDLNAVAAEHLLTIARGLLREADDLDVDAPKILLTHFTISGALLGNGRLAVADIFREPVLDANELTVLGYDAVLAGHLQRGQLVVDDPPIIYAGSPHPMDHGEEGYEHGMWLLDVESGEVDAQVMLLASRSFITLDYEPDQPGFPGLGTPDVSDEIVRVRYTATPAQARRIDNAQIRQMVLDAGAAKVTIQPEIVREDTARVAGMDDQVDEREALELWLGANGVDQPAVRAVLAEKHAMYLETARAR